MLDDLAMLRLDHWNRHIGRVEDMAAPSVPSVETARIPSVQPLNSRLEARFRKPSQQVVVRRHKAKAMAPKEAATDQLGEDLDARNVVGRRAEDVLFGDRAGCDVEVAGVLRAHLPSMPADLQRDCHTREPGSQKDANQVQSGDLRVSGRPSGVSPSQYET
jgi:hypothetical protein